MSGGEQQRLKLAAALLPQPDLLILDEPTAGLDPQARRGLIDDLRTMPAQGVTILLTTHVLPDVDDLADHVVVLAHGRPVAQGTVAELTGAADALTIRADADLAALPWPELLGDGLLVDSGRSGVVVIHGVPTPQVVARVTDALARRGILITSITVGRRTLEDLVIEAGRR